MVARWLREKPARVGSARPGSVLAPTQGSYHSTGAPDVPCGTPVGLEEPIDVFIPSGLLTPGNVTVGLHAELMMLIPSLETVPQTRCSLEQPAAADIRP